MNHRDLVRPLRRGGALAVLATLGLAAPALAAGHTHQQTAQAGGVTATYSYQGQYPNFGHERLVISQSGKTVYDQPVHSHLMCGSTCAPGSDRSLHLIDLNHTGTDNVVLDLFSGGAHCCTIEQVFTYDATRGTYVMAEHNFGNPGDVLRDLGHDGRYEFVSGDDRFAYRFTDYAASGFPVHILTFAQGRFHDATRAYKHLIAVDARAWMKAYRGQARNHYSDSVGLIAAWAADEDLLGHSALVRRTLRREARAGHLNSALYGARDSGTRFIADLMKFLRRSGYRH